MNALPLGPVRSVFLLGGGSVLVALAEEIRAMDLSVRILTSPRLATELLEDGARFEERIRQLGFPLWVYADLRADLVPLSEITPLTLGLSLGATWIFREEVIRLFGGRLLNCHAACLPEDRGGGGFSWRILKADRRGRCLLHQVDSGVDTGRIVCSLDYTFSDRCRIPLDFFEEQRRRDLAFLIDFIRKVKVGCTFHPIPQDHSMAAYWPRLDTPIHGAIDWRWNVEEVERFICAFDKPYPGAFTTHSDRIVRLKDCLRCTGEGPFHPFQAGLIYRIHQGKLYVACVGGNLAIGCVTDSEGRDLLGEIRVGDRFWTPEATLERAKRIRVIRTSTGYWTKPVEGGLDGILKTEYEAAAPRGHDETDQRRS